MALIPNYQPKSLNKFLKPLVSLEKVWQKLNSLLDKEIELVLKGDLYLLEKLVNLENSYIKEIFDLGNLIQKLEMDLKKQGYFLTPLFNTWYKKEKINKENYLRKKEKIIYNIKKKKEKILEQTESLNERISPSIRLHHQNFPLPKILDIQI